MQRAAARVRRAGVGAPLARADVGRATARTRCRFARATALRVFAVATPNGYTVMPGALTRVAPHERRRRLDAVGRLEQGHVDARGRARSRASRSDGRGSASTDVAQSGVDIASRVGENLFWMGRYAERCEAIARLLRAALVRLADAAPQALARARVARAR